MSINQAWKKEINDLLNKQEALYPTNKRNLTLLKNTLLAVNSKEEWELLTDYKKNKSKQRKSDHHLSDFVLDYLFAPNDLLIRISRASVSLQVERRSKERPTMYPLNTPGMV